MLEIDFTHKVTDELDGDLKSITTRSFKKSFLKLCTDGDIGPNAGPPLGEKTCRIVYESNEKHVPLYVKAARQGKTPNYLCKMALKCFDLGE
ncbi:unnamed protein product, partial [Mesorhabditis belari]|uniref:Uncharacterized protein n=1 Tax=Mesorhabditis belari TaxID=2138241 RepID=A0AAF3FDF6_9BILA